MIEMCSKTFIEIMNIAKAFINVHDDRTSCSTVHLHFQDDVCTVTALDGVTAIITKRACKTNKEELDVFVPLITIPKGNYTVGIDDVGENIEILSTQGKQVIKKCDSNAIDIAKFVSENENGIEICFNTEILNRVFNALKKEGKVFLTIQAPNKPMVFKTNSAQGVVLPIYKKQ